jgi:hypothetical protein
VTDEDRDLLAPGPPIAEPPWIPALRVRVSHVNEDASLRIYG